MASSVREAKGIKTGMVMSLWHGSGHLHAAHQDSVATQHAQPHVCGTTLAHHHMYFDQALIPHGMNASVLR